MKINVIDLFAGCGGLTEGFLQTRKYNTLAAVDWELPTVQTLKNRLATKWKYKDVDSSILHFDLQRTDDLLNGYDDALYGHSVGLKKIIGSQSVDLIVGGPPCQAYSMAGRVRDENGMRDDYRNYLFESYAKMVEQFQPKAFVFENVEGILSAQPGGIPITKRIRESFLEIGYEISADLRKDALFDTSFFGVPQKRKRVIIYGVRKSSNSQSQLSNFYSSMRLLESKEPTTAARVFEDLPKFLPVKMKDQTKISHVTHDDFGTVYNHEPRFHSERDVKIFKILTSDIKDKKFQYTNTKSLIDLYEATTGKKSKFHKYHVIRTDKPSNTIPAHLYKDGLRHIHPDPEQARSITVREAARIQTFEDDFVFLGSKGDQFKMIGNAVPPVFARFIAQVVYDLNISEIKSL